MQLKFFGQLAEITGATELTITAEKDTDTVISKVKQQFPKLEKHTFLIAVDKKIIKQNQQLAHNSEVAFLPPFAGG